MPRSTCHPSSRRSGPRAPKRQSRLPACRRAGSASSCWDTPCSRRCSTTSPRRRPHTADRSTMNWTARSRSPCLPWIAFGWTKRCIRSRPPRATPWVACAYGAATINDCNEIVPASASWVVTRADGTEVEREPWSCVPDTPPISHLELIKDHGKLEYEGVPGAVRAILEWELPPRQVHPRVAVRAHPWPGRPWAREHHHRAALRNQAERPAGPDR